MKKEEPRISEYVKVLIVEDENLVALDIERGLKKLGYTVVASVNNGAEAIRKTAEITPDLILMDIQIKGDIDGIETSNRIHEKFNIPVVFLTAHADEATLQRAKLSGPFGYILKPFEETELHTAIQVALQKYKVVSEQQASVQMELAESEERFKALVESVKEYAICILDVHGNISSWNLGAQRIFGYDFNEALGLSLTYFFEENDNLSGAAPWALDEARLTGSFQEEGWRLRKDGARFWAHMTLTRMINKDKEHSGYSMVIRDLTDKKRGEDRLRLANESLERRIQERTQKLSEALQIRDEFLSIASHELKNPLATLCLQLSLLNRHISEFFAKDHNLAEHPTSASPETIDKLAKAVASCERQSKRLTLLIDELLDLTRIRAGKIELNKEFVNLSELVSNYIGHQKLDQPNAPDINFVDSKDIIIGKWDKSRIEQVVNNLLSNAIKYGNAKPIDVNIDVDNESQVAHICVKDRGIGIPLEFQENIFNKFQRSSEVRSINGLGLGLYIVKKIIEAHGGRVFVHSLQNQGSTFIVELPLGHKKEMETSGSEPLQREMQI